MEAAVEAHGWTPETVALWVSRNGTYCGQHGHEATWITPSSDTVEEWIGDESDRRSLVVRLIAGSLMSMLNWKRDGDDAYFMHAVMADDGVDIFFRPTALSEAGLGNSAEGIVADALAHAKSEVSRHVCEGSVPSHWLEELTK